MTENNTWINKIVLSEDKKELAKNLREKHKTLNWTQVDEIINQKDDKEIRYEWFTWDLDALEKAWLEPFNFKVDSSNWKNELDQSWKEIIINWFPIKESPTQDIWEITMLDWSKEQFFTSISAIRETEKLGFDIPSSEDWGNICKSYGQDWKKLSYDLGLPLSGYYDRRVGYIRYGTWYYLSSTPIHIDYLML